jgi:hypothetical protein
MNTIIEIFLIGMLATLASSTQQLFSTLDCSSMTNAGTPSLGTSCSPTQCTASTQPDCSFSSSDYDHAAWLASLTCKSCTQATSGVCTSLSSTLSTSGDHVKAAYCNDEYLVIMSDGISDLQTLSQIPLPPGGDPGQNCRVRTHGEQVQVYKST